MKKWLFIFLSIGILFSCNRDNIVSPTGEKSTHTTGELKAYLASPEATTRSGWENQNYDEYFPDGDIFNDEDSKHERWLHNLSIVYFDSDFNLEHFVTWVNYKEDNRATDIYSNKGTSGEFSSFPLGTSTFPLTTGAHYFYILCNLPWDILEDINEMYNEKKYTITKDELEKYVMVDHPLESIVSYFEAASIGGGMTPQPRCMMTNTVSPPPLIIWQINRFSPEVHIRM